MPTYKFHNKETDEVFDHFISISAREEFLKSNPHIQQVIEAPAFISKTSVNKVPAGFKDVISKVADAHPESPLADKYRRKTIKETRTKAIVDKHYKKMKRD
jgi:hypothetical protein